jgi:radical SAM superfamily enzyme YgiQ (UPF0313 family)
MKVLMINPNRFRWHVAPLGLEYVCNSLLRENIEFDVLDFNFEPENNVYKRLETGEYDLVGINVRNIDTSFLAKVEFFLPDIKTLIQKIKNTHQCNVVLGGTGYTVLPEEILNYTGADFGVAGYGEEALPKLVRALREGGDFKSIDNLVWRNNGNIVSNPRSMGNYKDFPARKRSVIRNRSYFGVLGVANIETLRGCTMRCGFCNIPNIVGNKVVTRHIPHLIDELKELKAMGCHHLFFCDSEFNMAPPEYSMELCDAIIRADLGITWSANLIPVRNMISMDILKAMKKAGCNEVLISADNGSDTILASMNKPHKAEDIALYTEYVREAGIQSIHTYLYGWPGESHATLDENVELIRRTKPDQSIIYAGIRIFPDTRLQEIAIEEGEITANTDLVQPVYYRPDWVLNEIIPYIHDKTKNIPGCVHPSKHIDFLNLFRQNACLLGKIPSGFVEFVDYIENLSFKDKLQVLGSTMLDYLFPSRCRYIPIADGDQPPS